MAGEKILVVEDETIIAFNLQRILMGFGYQVPETVESSLEAIRVVESLQPDLVLMDIQLRGGMDGIEAARKIRTDYDIPIVFLTAYAEDTRLAEARKTTPYGYLVKPVQERELRATIEMALFKHKIDLKLQESEEAYRELYHNTPAMLLTISPQSRIVQISDYCLMVMGYSREDVVDHDPLEFVAHNSHKPLLEQITPEFFHSGIVRDAECQICCKNGQLLDAYFSAIGIFDAHGELLHVLVALVDITARKHAEAAERYQRALAEALRDTAAALSSTLRLDEVLERVLTNVGKVVPHDAVNIMLVEGETAHIVRSQGYEALGKGAYANEHPINIQELPFLKTMSETLQPVTFPDTCLLPFWKPAWVRSYAGAPIVIKGRLVGFINLDGLTPGFYCAEHTIRLQAFADQAAIAIENARLYAEVTRLATLDEVTGIANRRRLFELGQHEFERARRYGQPLAAILLDIDRFKKINDTYGHTTGDRVLAGIAKMISSNIREVDRFGRYGGEEFVVLLPQTSRQAALEVADRLLALVNGLRFQTERGTFSVTISVGVAMLTHDTSSLATLIDWADQAMYAAKQAGRNRVEVYA